jgi:uncharacterized protein (TIGR00661 family)
MTILYGVPGEGMGHAARARVVIDYLLQIGHDVQIVSSDRTAQFLEQHFPGRVFTIDGFRFGYHSNGAVSVRKTLKRILKNASHKLQRHANVYRLLHEGFQFDWVLSDFESFSMLYAKRFDLPLLSIDNIQILHRTKPDITIPSTMRSSFQMARNIVQFKVPGAKQYWISSFFPAQIIQPNTKLIPPIIRPEVLQAKVTTGNHVLVYQRSISVEHLQSILSAFSDINFFCYGHDQSFQSGHIIFKPFSEKEFLKDLAESKAVICNSGYSLLSECVYLKKPVLAIPIPQQAEQWLNAAAIEKLGYGQHAEFFHESDIRQFLNHLHLFQQTLEAYLQTGNDELYALLDQLPNL